ncbi:hypothetical protein DPMN_070766 [Dreissena polymorpha]|uniref:Uncharacterized protein n=1 Tax=Dreissena polymorpha TaxID=45954 RepID=A0A9D3Z3N9_DREPO|nr:hypothetical protein DPMN_070766 [Dreissena polymorpha]
MTKSDITDNQGQGLWFIKEIIARVHHVSMDTSPQCLEEALANIVDPDETPHDAASHLGLRCLLKGISVDIF